MMAFIIYKWSLKHILFIKDEGVTNVSVAGVVHQLLIVHSEHHVMHHLVLPCEDKILCYILKQLVTKIITKCE